MQNQPAISSKIATMFSGISTSKMNVYLHLPMERIENAIIINWDLEVID